MEISASRAPKKKIRETQTTAAHPLLSRAITIFSFIARVLSDLEFSAVGQKRACWDSEISARGPRKKNPRNSNHGLTSPAFAGDNDFQRQSARIERPRIFAPYGWPPWTWRFPQRPGRGRGPTPPESWGLGGGEGVAVAGPAGARRGGRDGGVPAYEARRPQTKAGAGWCLRTETFACTHELRAGRREGGAGRWGGVGRRRGGAGRGGRGGPAGRLD